MLPTQPIYRAAELCTIGRCYGFDPYSLFIGFCIITVSMRKQVNFELMGDSDFPHSVLSLNVVEKSNWNARTHSRPHSLARISFSKYLFRIVDHPGPWLSILLSSPTSCRNSYLHLHHHLRPSALLSLLSFHVYSSLLRFIISDNLTVYTRP